MSDANFLRLILALAGAAWLVYIWWSGTRKPGQGARRGGAKAAKAPRGERLEPSMSDVDVDLDDDASRPARGTPLDPDLEAELHRLSATMRDTHDGDDAAEPRGRRTASRAAETAVDADDEAADAARVDAALEREIARGGPSPKAQLTRPVAGANAEQRFDRIVSLHVAARAGENIAGPELVVAAEKSGLTYGDRGIFHRLVDGKADGQAIFRVANMVKPGNFDPSTISELRTPGVTFFMTLPGPLRALDAWDTMLPAAQRFAELLDAQLLDEEKNTLGRQTIQHIRDELRAFDRQTEKNTIKRSW